MKLILLILSLSFTNLSFAYQELASYKYLSLPNDHKKTWVIFDIDNTLLRPTTEIGSHQWADYMAQRFLKTGHTEEEAKVYQTQIFSRAQKFVKPVIVDNNIYEFVKNLKSNNIPFLALTARSSQVLRETTIDQMRSVGLLPSFDQSHPSWNYSTDISTYTQQGIVFSNGLQKGDILKKLINTAVEKPERIIFIDDKDYNVKSIEKAGLEIGIEVMGFRFSATDNIVSHFNPKKADQEWYAAKYLNSPVEAHSLNTPYSLGFSLLKMEFGNRLISNSEKCSAIAQQNFIQLNCEAEIVSGVQGYQIINRTNLIKYSSEEQFYTKLDWDIF